MWIHTDRYGMTWINHDKTINHFRPMFTRIPTLCLTLLRQSQHIQHVVQLYNLTKPVIAGKGQQSKWNMNEWDGNSLCNSVFFHTVTPEVDYLWHPVTTRNVSGMMYLNRSQLSQPSYSDRGKWRWCRALCSGIAEVQSATEAKPELHDIIDILRCQGCVIAR